MQVFFLSCLAFLVLVTGFAYGHSLGFKEGMAQMIKNFRRYSSEHADWDVSQMADNEEAKMKGEIPRGF